MAFDNHKNFAYTTVANTPGTAGTTVIVQTGTGSRFPAVPFNAVVCPFGQLPTPNNAEVVRVTFINGDYLTVTRAQESSTARSIATGDQFFLGITAKTITDLETAIAGITIPDTIAKVNWTINADGTFFFKSPTYNQGISIVWTGSGRGYDFKDIATGNWVINQFGQFTGSRYRTPKLEISDNIIWSPKAGLFDNAGLSTYFSDDLGAPYINLKGVAGLAVSGDALFDTIGGILSFNSDDGTAIAHVKGAIDRFGRHYIHAGFYLTNNGDSARGLWIHESGVYVNPHRLYNALNISLPTFSVNGNAIIGDADEAAELGFDGPTNGLYVSGQLLVGDTSFGQYEALRVGGNACIMGCLNLGSAASYTDIGPWTFKVTGGGAYITGDIILEGAVEVRSNSLTVGSDITAGGNITTAAKLTARSIAADVVSVPISMTLSDTIGNTVILPNTNTTVTLPDATTDNKGKTITIKSTATGATYVAPPSSGQTIDGSTAPRNLSAQYKYITVQSTGSVWIIIGSN